MKKIMTVLLAPFKLAINAWPFTALFVLAMLVAYLEQKTEYNNARAAWVRCVTNPESCSCFEKLESNFWQKEFLKLPRGARI